MMATAAVFGDAVSSFWQAEPPAGAEGLLFNAACQIV